MRSLGAPDGEAEKALAAADTQHNGVITFEEFCAAVGPVYDYSHMALRRAFDVFDTDHNGSIERAELKTMLTKLRLLPADADPVVFEKIWSLADTNKDGKSGRSPRTIETSPSRCNVCNTLAHSCSLTASFRVPCLTACVPAVEFDEFVRLFQHETVSKRASQRL